MDMVLMMKTIDTTGPRRKPAARTPIATFLGRNAVRRVRVGRLAGQGSDAKG